MLAKDNNDQNYQVLYIDGENNFNILAIKQGLIVTINKEDNHQGFL